MSDEHLPTPEQRADVVVRQLEKFIREGKSAKGGMSFTTWQAMAKEEIVSVIRAHRHAVFEKERVARRMTLVVATTLVTLGFWGTTILIDKTYGAVAALIFGVSGLILAAIGIEWGIRFAVSRHLAEERIKNLAAIEGLDRKIRKLKYEMQLKKEELEEQLEKES
jgi:hypothetical protein